jgi:hypothetical protein
MRSGNTLRSGMPKAPQGNIQGRPKHLSFGDSLDGIPSFVYNLSVCYLELYFYSSHDMSFAWSVLYHSFALFAF